MAKTITWVPGIAGIGVSIPLPPGVPRIDRVVVAAQIVRIRAGLGIPDHAVHSHPLAFSGGGAGGTIIAGAVLLSLSAGAQVIGAGGPAGDGVRDNGAPQAHGALTAANPVVAVVAAKVDQDNISLDTATTLGDLLALTYQPIGCRLAA